MDGLGFIFPGRFVTVPFGYLNALTYLAMFSRKERQELDVKQKFLLDGVKDVPCHLSQGTVSPALLLPTLYH